MDFGKFEGKNKGKKTVRKFGRKKWKKIKINLNIIIFLMFFQIYFSSFFSYIKDEEFENVLVLNYFHCIWSSFTFSMVNQSKIFWVPSYFFFLYKKSMKVLTSILILAISIWIRILSNLHSFLQSVSEIGIETINKIFLFFYFW